MPGNTRPQAAAYNLSDVQNVVSQLVETRQRLSTDPSFFVSQRLKLLLIAEWVVMTRSCAEHQLKQALLHDNSMRLLEQIMQIAAACMQQVTAQLSDHAAPKDMVTDVCLVSAVFCEALEHGQACLVQRTSDNQVVQSPDLDQQALRVLQNTGQCVITGTITSTQESGCACSVPLHATGL